jgi:hypothetical protein
MRGYNLGGSRASNPGMKRLALLIGVLVLLAGCGGAEEQWGGYTEGEAKDVMGALRQEIIANAPGDPATSPYNQLLPTRKDLDNIDLRRVTMQGAESWEYRDQENNFCLNVSEDPKTKAPNTYVGICNSD